MTISRKVVKVKTVGSLQKRNLRPAIAEELPKGLNYYVYEYSDDGTCVLELWCSDHTMLKSDERQDSNFLTNYAKTNENILVEFNRHPASPLILGRIVMTGGSHSEPVVEDEKQKTISYKDRTGKFLRKEKIKEHGIEKDLYILDEG